MNIVLFTEEELLSPLPLSDERSRHILGILKKSSGGEFKAGIENGELGTARIESIGDAGLTLSFAPSRRPAPLRPLSILLGFPRPIQANRILKDLSSLGARRILLSGTELGEKSYVQGSFFSSSGWERAIREGAAQAGNPLLPEVSVHRSLGAAIASLPEGAGAKIALDPKEPEFPLRELRLGKEGAVLAVGSERGWTDSERGTLRASGFRLAGLGDRILRTETATILAAGLCLAAMGEL